MPAAPPPVPVTLGGGAGHGPFQSRSRIHLVFAAAVATMAAAAAMLRRFPPATSSFYPRCLIHQYTGLLCPGCGATRAFAALAHGHIPEALHFNALVTLLLPCAAAYGILLYAQVLRHPAVRLKPFPIPATALLLTITCLFTLFRNLS